jgi:hypothetical protein
VLTSWLLRDISHCEARGDPNRPSARYRLVTHQCIAPRTSGCIQNRTAPIPVVAPVHSDLELALEAGGWRERRFHPQRPPPQPSGLGPAAPGSPVLHLVLRLHQPVLAFEPVLFDALPEDGIRVGQFCRSLLNAARVPHSTLPAAAPFGKIQRKPEPSPARVRGRPGSVHNQPRRVRML